jgi:hypothetical protein
MERVLLLDPRPRAQVFDHYAFVLYMNHRYEEALEALRRIEPGQRSDIGLEVLAMANARLGRMAEARGAVAAILDRSPSQSLSVMRVVYAHHRRTADLDHRLDALRAAGYPEWSYDFHGRPEDRLDAAAIRRLIAAGTWSGHTNDGVPFFMELDPKGEFAVGSGTSSLISGSFTVEGDAFCTRSSASLLGRTFCSPVYRNPGGRKESRNGYVFPDSSGIWYFTPSP